MPKEFPQIRLNGDKTQAVGHIKRGMLELFKTQSWQELAGIPITKRTVEVDPSTTITVQVAKEQTFVDITSTGEEFEVEEEGEEKERDSSKCPSAFIIRKQDYAGHQITQNPGMYQEKGYIIAYNRLRDKWGIASFLAPDGETFAHASNLGWWHVNDGEEHTSCDVITWNGQSNFDFSPTYVWPTVSSGNPAITALSRNFFFRGRMFSAPSGDVMGACIINAGGVDYIYVHVLSTTSRVTTINSRRVTSLSSHRMTLGALLSGGTDWVEQGRATWDDFEIPYDFGTTPWFDYPRSSAYIDKDGFSYVLLSSKEDVGIAEYTRMTRFIKFDLRDMSWEVLNSSVGSQPTEEWAGNWTECLILLTAGGGSPAGEYLPDDDGTTMNCHWTYSNKGRPWIFHMLGGTQNLWTYAIEWDLWSDYSWLGWNTDDFGNDADLHAVESHLSGSVDLIISKDGREHERIPLVTLAGSSSGTFGVRATDNPDTELVPGQSGTFKGVFEHHPDIDNSERSSVLSVLNGGSTQTLSLLEDGQLQNFANGTTGGVAPSPSYTGNPVSQFSIWFSPCVHASRAMVVADADPGSTANLGSASRTSERYSHVELPFYELMWQTPGNIMSRINAVYRSSGVATLVPYFGVGSRPTANSIGPWGSSEGFIVPKQEGQEKAWHVEAFAVHRPTDTRRGTKKPYLHLRRPIKNGTPASMEWGDADRTGNDNTTRSIKNAKKHPATYPHGEQDELGQPTGGFPNYDRDDWWFWTEPVGHLLPEDFPDPDWEAGDKVEPVWEDDDWELKSNVLTAKQLNKLTKELGNAFFEIGVL